MRESWPGRPGPGACAVLLLVMTAVSGLAPDAPVTFMLGAMSLAMAALALARARRARSAADGVPKGTHPPEGGHPDEADALVALAARALADPQPARALGGFLDDFDGLTGARFSLVAATERSAAGGWSYRLLDHRSILWADTPASDNSARRPSYRDLQSMLDLAIAQRRVVDARQTGAAQLPAGLVEARWRVWPLLHDDVLVGLLAGGGWAGDGPTTASGGRLAAIAAALVARAAAATEQAKQSEAAAAREEMFLDLFDSASDLIHSVRPDGGFAYVNRAWLATLGYERADLAKLTIADVVHPDDRAFYARIFADAAAGHPPRPHQLRLVARDGRVIDVEGLEGCRMVDGVPAVTRAIYRDVTARAAADAALRAAKQAAEEAADAKTHFLANMSHELRTPLNAVTGMTNELLATSLTGEQRQLVAGVRAAGETLLDVIGGVLEYSTIESGTVALQSAPFDVRDLVERALDAVAEAASRKSLELAAFIAPDTPARFVGDAARLHQILVILLGNAVKFTPAGEVIVALDATPSGGTWNVHLRVSDSGIGIPSERLDRLFRPFSQVESGINRRHGGSGLGLAICRRLVEAMGGRIWVESRPAGGSIFHVTIAAPAPPPGEAAPAPQPRLRDKRVLVAAGHPALRRMVVQLVSGFGMRVTAAATADTARAALAGAGFDIFVADAAFGEGGLHGLDEASAASGVVPAVVLLPAGTPGSQSARPNLAFVSKPPRLAALRDAIEWALAPATAADAHAAAPDAALSSAMRLLLVDDNPINQEVALRLLQRLGYRADVAGNGREALTRLARTRYDIVLLDVQMPDIDGFQVARTLRTRLGESERPRIVGMTALASSGDRERCLAAGMDDYLAKPVQPDALKRVLERATPIIPLADTADQIEEPVDRAVIERLRQLQNPAEPDFVRPMIHRFLDALPGELIELQRAAARGAAPEVERRAHRLKSSCATLGALELAGLCQQLETSSAGGDLSDASALVERLEAAGRRVRPRLAALA